MPFNPDQFLAETAPVDEGFNPDQFLAETSAQPSQIKPGIIDQNQEANLGFTTRAKYAIEPLESNRRALLQQQFGADNVIEPTPGEILVRQGDKFLPVNKKGFSAADLADFAGSLPETIGAGAGMVSGALMGGGALSVPAAVGLGVAGGVVGSTARQALSSALGTPQIATPIERLTETGLSGIMGGAGTALGLGAGAAKQAVKTEIRAFKDVATKLGSDVLKRIPGGEAAIEGSDALFNASKSVIQNLLKKATPTLAQDRAVFEEIALKNGLTAKEPHIFGKSSIVTRTEKALAGVDEVRLKDYWDTHAQITDKVLGEIPKLSEVRLAPGRNAGEYIQNTIEKKGKEFFDNLDVTYKTIVDETPGAMLSPASLQRIDSAVNGLEKYAKGRVVRGFGGQRQEAKSLLQDVKSLRASKGSLKQTVEALKNIGEEAFKKVTPGENRTPIDRKKMQEMYFTLQKEVIESVRETHGDDVADSLLRNNELVHDFLGEKNVLIKVLGRENQSPEKIFDALVKNGDTAKIESMKAIMGVDFQPVKTAALESLISRNADGFVMYDKTIRNLATTKNKDLMAAIFKPEELQNFTDLLKFGSRMGEPELNTSKTETTRQLFKLVETAKNSIVNETTLDIMKKKAYEAEKKGIKKIVKEATKPVGFPSLKYGAAANVFTDQRQRDAAYFTRGPMPEPKKDERTQRQKALGL